MGLLYAEEHTSCLNYDNGYRPVIEIITIEKGQEYSYTAHDHKLLFVKEGKLLLSYGECWHKEFLPEEFTFLSSLSSIKYKALEDTQVVLFRIREYIKLCDRYSMERLKDEVDAGVKNEGLVFLKFDPVLKDFIKSVVERYTDGLRCFYYSNLKVQELFFILRAYYKKEDLARLFYLLLSDDIQFSDFIYQNYTKVKTVKELADKANYSVSGFEKRFKKTFGISAGSWLNKKRAVQIYHEINCSMKPLKIITSEYGFSSPSHFNDYCKSQFGDTPGGIRQSRASALKKE